MNEINYQKTTKFTIIEDSPVDQMVLSGFLKVLFPLAEITVVDSVEEGIKSLKENPPHLLLLDMYIQNRLGIEVLANLFEERLQGKFPILMLTGDQRDEPLQIALDAGVDDFMTKPIDDLVLRSKVESLLFEAYTSPFAFLGRQDPLAAIEIKFDIVIQSFSESNILFAANVNIVRGSVVNINYRNMVLPIRILECTPNANKKGHIIMGMIMNEKMSIEEQVGVRRMIINLGTGGKKLGSATRT